MVKSKDAYYEKKDNLFIIGTEKTEKVLELTSDGSFYAKSVKNKITGKEYVWNAPIASDEFFIQIDKKYYSGGTPGWTFASAKTQILSQEELEVVIVLLNHVVEVKRHYVIYPGQPVIQEWTEYRNITDKTLSIDKPSLFVWRILGEKPDDINFSYMTGGACFSGSQIFKTVPLSEGFVKDFDSQKNPEIIEVDGHEGNIWHNRLNGAGIWNEIFALSDRKEEEGFYLTFDYQGCWKAQMCSRDRNVALTGWCDLLNYPLEQGESIKLAPSAFGCYSGDFDDLGNTINDYIYTYKWDFTNDTYFNRTSLSIWRSAPLTDKVFDMIKAASYMGYERIWVDDFWFDAKGNWNGIFEDDWNEINRYLAEHNMIFRLWMPPWHADRLSQVWLEHPEWMLDFHGNWYNWTIDMSKEEAYQWILNMLCDKQKEFGTYDLRVDGDPCNLWNNRSFDAEGGNWNGTHKQSENFYRLYREFKERNPEAGLDGCSSGGHTLGIESGRYVDQQQITDGWCFHMGGYWTTMILPIDKHQGMSIAGTSRDDMWENPDNVYMNLFSAPVDGMQNPEAGADIRVMEEKRKNLELFYWLRKQGIYGRYIKVYRPQTEHGDPTFLLQRMTWDGKKGLVMISCDPLNPMHGKSERIFIKGLLEDEEYYVDSQLGSVKPETKTGKQWMQCGVELQDVRPGEYVYINLPNRPGKGSCAERPDAPLGISIRKETWLRREGISVRWNAPAEMQNISYYEIFKNNINYTKVSTGTFFFDTQGCIDDVYQIRSVDYDGNTSDFAQA